MPDPAFFALLFLAAVLYTSVGHAGASGYLAVMTFYAMSQETVYASRPRPGGDTESRVGGHTTGRVIRAPKGGGTPVTVVSQPTGLDTLRLGATRYVWRGGGPYEFHSAPK